MTIDEKEEQLPDESGAQRVSFVELLFDVVFVFALTRLSRHLIEELTWHGAVQTLIQLLAVSWIWFLTVWLTNRYNANRGLVQLLVIGTMLGSLFLAAAIPAGFRERGSVFVAAYLIIQIGRPTVLALFLRGPINRRNVLNIYAWLALSIGPWIAGAFFPPPTRTLLWALAIALDIMATRLDYPTPWLRRANILETNIGGEHLTERYRQFTIVAFGETILSAGFRFSDHDFDGDHALAFVVAFTGTVLLWRIYFYRAGELLHEAIMLSATPLRTGRTAAYAHVIMIGGIVVTSVGDEIIVRYPFGPVETPWIVVLIGGAALFLVGRALLDFTTFSRVSWSRVIGLLVLAVMAPAMPQLPPVLVASAVTLVLAGVAVSNAISWRLFPVHPKAPVL
ncbi:MAG TPA: low temperature requirement protein A [Micromonospora sp.]|nr:low temperature requirement protein A [Micromonospora sp.]